MTTATADLAIDLKGVDKTYTGGWFQRGVHALRGIDMHVGRGEVFGLLGPNGAGKSTLVKILMTVIRPSNATGLVLGKPVGHKPTLARVGYLPEHHRFPDYLTGRQVVEFSGAMSGVPARACRKRGAELLDFVGMGRWADTRVRSYSKGMRQRVGIAQALVNTPELVLLDEPTDGVDPVGRREIREMMLELKRRGTTVFLNSHLLSELEMVCDRVAILVQGRVASQGTIDQLTTHRKRYEVELESSDSHVDSKIREVFARWIPAQATEGTLPDGSAVSFRIEAPHQPVQVRVGSVEAASVQPVIDAARAAGLTIRSVRPIRPSLEDLFMEAVTDPLTGKTLGPGAKEGN
ncbi:MAG: ABC transporter ATP-binding protein [Planctomycetes bacterium]|nr:ABC transporter ATP-binding protein [Planctomycetota bacterium]